CGCGTSASAASRRSCSARWRWRHPPASWGSGLRLWSKRSPRARRRGTAPDRRRAPRAVILLGDAPYYARFGFSAAKTGGLSLPGAFERDRLLGLELDEGALDDAWGMIAPAARPLTKAKASRARKALLVPRV